MTDSTTQYRDTATAHETDREPRDTDRIGGMLALSPVILFLLSYVAVSVILDDFYAMPLPVSLLLSSVWAIVIYRGRPLSQRIETFSRAAGHDNILYMIWIFILAGAFATLAKQLGAVEATVQMVLGVFPPGLVVPAIFLASCFISLSIGTSVGTVVALTPLASGMAVTAGASVPFYVAVVLGGAFFGDNLSFISDTTIAATRSQKVGMSDKFKANLWIAVPAAIVTLALYVVMSHDAPPLEVAPAEKPWLVLPYITVIVMAAAGVSVSIVLACGIAVTLAIGLGYGHGLLPMATYMGQGIESLGTLIIVTLMAAGMLGIVKAAGGIRYMLTALTRHISGSRGGQAVIALLVAAVNLCTANNTVAIITVGGISHTIAGRYGIPGRKSASLLDSASCVVQCLIPYGAQTLLATSLAGISPGAPWPYLYYPWALAFFIAVSIVIKRRR